MHFDQIDGPTWALILTALTTIGGFVTAIVRWSRGQFNVFVGWVQPKIEQGFTGHMELVESLKTTQIEAAVHIGKINTKLDTVESTLSDHTKKLDRIEGQTCRTTPGPAVSNA